MMYEKLSEMTKRNPALLPFLEHLHECEQCRKEVQENLQGYPWADHSLMCEVGDQLLQKATAENVKP